MDLNGLFAEALTGTPDARERLFHHLTVRFRLFVLYRLGDTQEAEDIVQDTVMAVAEKYETMPPDSNFAGWAYSILENKLRLFFRNRKYDREKLAWYGQHASGANPTSADPDLKTRLTACLKKICRTNRRYARILALYYQGYTTKEICDRLGITPNNTYVIFSRAKSMLKACLDEEEE